MRELPHRVAVLSIQKSRKEGPPGARIRFTLHPGPRHRFQISVGFPGNRPTSRPCNVVSAGTVVVRLDLTLSCSGSRNHIYRTVAATMLVNSYTSGTCNRPDKRTSPRCPHKHPPPVPLSGEASSPLRRPERSALRSHPDPLPLPKKG